jgi:hypothetical protein
MPHCGIHGMLAANCMPPSGMKLHQSPAETTNSASETTSAMDRARGAGAATTNSAPTTGSRRRTGTTQP